MQFSKSVSSIAVVVLLVLCMVAATFSPLAQAANDSKAAVTASPTGGASTWHNETVDSDGGVGTWSTWEPLSGQLTASPAAVSWADGRIDVFGRGSDNSLWWRHYNDSTWSTWEPLSGQLAPTTGPAASSWAAGHLDVFIIGSDNALWHRSYNNSAWSVWEPLSGQLTASPAAVSWADGRIDVFGRGSDNSLWWRHYNDSTWSTWEPLSGQLAPTTGPAASSWAAGHLDVFIIGSDNALWQKTYDNNVWTAWQPLSGQLTASPGAVSWADGRIDVFGRGSDNSLWWRHYNNSAWSTWEPLSGQLAPTTGPAASSQDAGKLDVFVIGSDNALWHRSYVAVPTRTSLSVSKAGPAINEQVTFTAKLEKRHVMLGMVFWDPIPSQSTPPLEIVHYENGVMVTDAANTTDSNGVIKWNASWPSTGARTYYAYFGGNTTYASSLSKGVTVTPNATTSIGCGIPLSTPEGETYTINGTLKDNSGRGLADMTVYIVGDVNATLVTDASGYFSMTGISRGDTCGLTGCTVCVHSEFHGEGYYLASMSPVNCGFA
jgi:hypothetical protein